MFLVLIIPPTRLWCLDSSNRQQTRRGWVFLFWGKSEPGGESEGWGGTPSVYCDGNQVTRDGFNVEKARDGAQAECDWKCWLRDRFCLFLTHASCLSVTPTLDSRKTPPQKSVILC